MVRSILAVSAVGLLLGVLTATGGCKQTGVGDPCTPEQEYNAAFNDFDEQEVNVESKSFQCETRLCLVNHFRGRVSCPYGQGADKSGPTLDNGGKVKGCTVPATQDPITGDPNDKEKGSAVRKQCLDRSADKTVYCSCRCANADGRTDDGANYCSCPDGFTCSQLVTKIGATDEGLAGAYCIKTDTEYDRNAAPCTTFCDPNKANCGPVALQ